jgi:NTE family protein
VTPAGRAHGVGLVLGAGGIVGAAYHAGVLAALAEAGFDGRDADVIVGTSAGSGVGATLRAGLSPADHLARACDHAVSAEGAALLARVGAPKPLPTSRVQVGVPRPSNPSLLLPWRRVRPSVALAGLLPAGGIDVSVVGDRVRALHAAWPERPLWICTVRLRDGRLVVLGRDAEPATDVATAVEASSAIPAFFTPVVIDGERYVDGGVHSPTNADLLARPPTPLRSVVVVSPMSATPRALRQPSLSGRPMFARRLATEIRALRRTGVTVHTFQPTPADVTVMGVNAMDFERRGDVARVAYESARERAREVVGALA